MKDCLWIGPTPSSEVCTPVSRTDEYLTQMRRECHEYVHQLRRVYGEEQGSAQLRVKREEHEFGEYLEVACCFYADDEVGVEYAFKVEKGCEKWDSEALFNLSKTMEEVV